MRLVVAIILLCSTLGLKAQEEQLAELRDGYIVGTSLGMSYDVSYTSKDINEYSSDMESLTEFGYVSHYQFGRNYGSKVQYGLKLNFGTVKGENEIEKAKTSFVELSAFSRYSFLNIPDIINVYASASVGLVEFKSTRYLMFDNARIPLNTGRDRGMKWDYAIGVERALSDNIICFAEACFNEVRHDGFDGWDYGTNVDRYNFYSLGMKFLLNKK